MAGAILGLVLTSVAELLSVLFPLYLRLTLLILFLSSFLLLEITNKTTILPAGNFAVPDHWVFPADNRSAAVWGTILGLGFITYQSGSLFHAMLLTGSLLGDGFQGLLIGAIYGFARAAIVAIPSTRSMVFKALMVNDGSETLLSKFRRNVSLIALVLMLILGFYKLV